MFQLLITLISIVQYVYSITLSDINRVSSVSNGTQLFYIDSSSPNPSQQFPESIINYNVWDFNSQSQFQTIPTTDSKFVSNTVFYYKSQFCLLTELITINCYYPDQNKMIKQRLQPTTSLDNKSFYLSGHTITQLKDSSYIIIGGMLTPPYNSGTLKPKASSSIFRLTEDRSLSVVEYSLSKFGFNTLIGHTTHVINNQLYIIGGADPTNGNKVNNQILIFNLNNGDSETIKGLPVVYHDSFGKL
ncbi:hypothetical protein K502DRAFT_30157 [Neoconidiobolus thromboides FSU 785]|nr:hypothetical protein K502DRAFT_30157 [Neoconidiobolus thromboides FSU 785]